MISQIGEKCNFSALKASQKWIQNHNSGSSWGLASLEAKQAGKVRKRITGEYKMDLKPELHVDNLNLYAPSPHADVDDAVQTTFIASQKQ